MTDYKEMSLSFVETKEMRECLRNTLLVGDDPIRVIEECGEIIVGSRANIDEKLEALRKLPSCKENEDLITVAEIALAERESITGDVFLVTMHYPYEENSTGYWGTKFERQPCLTFDKVISLVNKETQSELNYEKETIEECMNRFWYEVEKFSHFESDELTHKISWDLNAKGEIMFFKQGDLLKKCRLSKDTDDDDWLAWFYWEGSNDLSHSPVPFDFGDIITIDMRPYYDKLNGVIVRLDDLYGCCAVACIYIDEDGYLRCDTLKHNLHGCLTKVSPLYRAERFVGELHEDELILKSISEAIKKIPATKKAIENGRFWHEHALAELMENYLYARPYKKKEYNNDDRSWDEFREQFSIN